MRLRKRRKDDAAADPNTTFSEDVAVEDDDMPAEVPEAAADPQGAPTRVQQGVQVDDSQIVAGYANFCRVSSTPEELILDLGLNPQPAGQGDVKVQVSQRVIMNHYTAKRLLSALAMAVQRHETAFGAIETDVRKRLQSLE